MENKQSNQKNGIQNFSSLSRNALYAPLNSYVNKSNDRKEKKQNINKNLKEKSLYSFLEKVSVEYHSSNSNLGKLGGTNGGQPLRSRHMEAKIAQRALTLIGNGCNVPTAKSTSALSNDIEPVQKKRQKNKHTRYMHGSLPKRKRKRVEVDRKKAEKCDEEEKISVKEITSTNSDYCNGITKETLIGLNTMWNEYIKALLKQNKVCLSKEGLTERDDITKLISNAELIGAQVFIKNRITECVDAGILIEQSKNIWKVATPCGMKEKCHDCFTVDDVVWRIHVIPKDKISSLRLQLPRYECNRHGPGYKDLSGVFSIHVFL